MRRRIVRNRRFTRRRRFRRRPFKRSRTFNIMKNKLVKAAQEKKWNHTRFEVQNFNVLHAHVFGLQTLGSGGNSYTRMGTDVYLSGVRIHVNLTNTTNFTTDPTQNMYVYLYVASSKRSDNFTDKWFLNDTNDTIAFGSAADEAQASELRINKVTKKLHWGKIVKLEHYKPGNNAKYHYQNTFYVPINMKVNFDLNSMATATSQIYPRVAIIAYVLRPDQNVSLASGAVHCKIYGTWYYRE